MIETIHTVPGLVEWVGLYDGDKLLKICPIFQPGATTAAIGCVLLVDLARELTAPTNYTAGKLSIANLHELGDHLQTHFGTKLKGLSNNKPIGSLSNKLLASHLTKVLKANHLERSSQIENHKTRIRYKTGPVLLNVSANTKFSDLAHLAEWLGQTYTDLSSKLVAK